MGYNTFYSQLIRFFRLCNNKVDFIARVQLTYKKLYKRGYGHYKLLKTFRKFCDKYTACLKYGETDYAVLWEKSACHIIVKCIVNSLIMLKFVILFDHAQLC